MNSLVNSLVKSLVKSLSAILIGLLLVLSPVEIVFTPAGASIPFPYPTMEDVAKHAEGVTPGACQGEAGAVIAVEIPIRYFVLYIGNGKVLVGEWTSAETFNVVPPAFIWVGTVDPNGVLVFVSREPYNEAKHGTGPCRLLYPERYL